jgi:hypothetical protein
MFTLEKLIFLMNETFFTSLQVKTINNPFDFLAPGKNPGQPVNTNFPSKQCNKTLTLVLDLDETLIHFAYVSLTNYIITIYIRLIESIWRKFHC